MGSSKRTTRRERRHVSHADVFSPAPGVTWLSDLSMCAEHFPTCEDRALKTWKNTTTGVCRTLCAIPQILLQILADTVTLVWVQLQEYEVLKDR